MAEHIVGASVWEQELYDYVLSHVDQEQDIVEEYRALAEGGPSTAFRYLAGLILDDEVRHHRLMLDLAASIKTAAELSGAAEPIPDLRDLGAEGALALTQRFIQIEHNDLEHLQGLAKALKPVRDTTLWSLIIELMEDDTKKHVRILRFIEERLRHPIV